MYPGRSRAPQRAGAETRSGTQAIVHSCTQAIVQSPRTGDPPSDERSDLPARRLGSRRAAGELRWWHFLVFAVLELYAFPYFDKLRSAQEMPRLLLAEQIVERHVLYLDDRLGELSSRNDLSVGPDRHYYANKSPGPSLVAVPVYALARGLGKLSIRRAMWLVRAGTVTLPFLLFLPLFYRLTRWFSADEHARRAALVAFALASPVVPYAMLLYAHVLAAVCLGGSFAASVLLVRERSKRPWLLAMIAGLLAGLAPAMDYQATLAAPVIGIYVMARARSRFRHATVFAASALPPVLALLAYHNACFGSPFRISYSLGVDTAPRKGLLGFIGPNWQSFHNILFVPSNGLVTLAPWVVLSIAGAAMIVLCRRLRLRIGAEALVAASIVLVYLTFVGSMLPYMARGGWSAGSRQLVGMLPFAAWLATPALAWVGRYLATQVLVFASMLASLAIFFCAATTYPHWPDALQNPLYELSFPLLAHGYAVHSLGTWLGLHGIWSIMPLYALAYGWAGYLLVGRLPRRRIVVLFLSTALAAGIVVAGSRLPGSGYYATRAWNWVTATWEPPRG